MTTRRLSLSLATTIACCALGIGILVWFLAFRLRTSNKPAAHDAPATVPKMLKEEEINVVMLTPDAIQRLALRTAPMERQAMHRTRVYGGEVMVPAGQGIVVSAPLSGTLKAPPNGSPKAPPGETPNAPSQGVPRPGQTIEKGQVVFQLLPLLSPEGRMNLAAGKIDADALVKSAQTQLAAAQVALARAKRLFQSEAGSRRAVEEAQAQYDLAEKALEAASARSSLMQRTMGEVDKGTAAALNIESPETGILRSLSVAPEQNVPSGAPLFEVLQLDTAWVRAPVYVGDLPQIDAQAEGHVTNLTARPGGSRQSAKPIMAPPAANPTAGTVDLFFEIDNQKSKYSPGQRVAVELLLKDKAESLTAPWASVLHDVHGGTWVYEQTGELSFARRRVIVHHVSGETAVLAAGPAVGKKIVTAGAAELFGTEAGFSK